MITETVGIIYLVIAFLAGLMVGVIWDELRHDKEKNTNDYLDRMG